MDRAPLLQVTNLCKTYPDGWTLEGVSLSVHEGEIVGLLGPSGSGKTTLLRLLAGLETPDCGAIYVAGDDVSHAPPHRRRIGLMFQEYALFPHRDVFGNVAFGLQMQGLHRDEIQQRVAATLELVGLQGYDRRDVNQLSGGERQRVALARSLAPRPRLLMLDEPLGALDRPLRERLIQELPAILQDAGVTAITVTHDQEEAFAISDRLVVMHEGRVVQHGTPEEVYHRPADAWTARFLGLNNLLAAKTIRDGLVQTALGALEIGGAGLSGGPLSGPVQLLIRPEAARLDGDGPNVVDGIVRQRSFRGGFSRLIVAFPGCPDLEFALLSGVDVPGPGEAVSFSLDPLGLMILPAG